VYGTKAITTTRTVGEISVGATPTALNPFDGFISNVAVYPSVLSQARATAHYTAGLGSAFIAAALNFDAGFNNLFGGGIDS
jgi:cytochrome c biogenesis protein CcdA